MISNGSSSSSSSSSNNSRPATIYIQGELRTISTTLL